MLNKKSAFNKSKFSLTEPEYSLYSLPTLLNSMNDRKLLYKQIEIRLLHPRLNTTKNYFKKTCSSVFSDKPNELIPYSLALCSKSKNKLGKLKFQSSKNITK